MAASLSPPSAAVQAAEILREVFSSLQYGLTFRLWDGTELRLGQEVCPLTVTFRSPGAFKRVFLNPTVDEFAEAYCDGDLELDGDLIESMKAADAFEDLELPLWRRVLLGFRVRRLSA